MEMRKLSGQDLFPMLKILSRVKVKDMVLKFIKEREELSKSEKELTEEAAAEIGMNVFADIIDTAMCNLDMAREDINNLLASLCNVQVAEIKSLGMLEYTKLVMEFFSKEELSDFFKCISSSNAFRNLL